jgi:hypothetical protein
VTEAAQTTAAASPLPQQLSRKVSLKVDLEVRRKVRIELNRFPTQQIPQKPIRHWPHPEGCH